MLFTVASDCLYIQLQNKTGVICCIHKLLQEIFSDNFGNNRWRNKDMLERIYRDLKVVIDGSKYNTRFSMDDLHEDGSLMFTVQNIHACNTLHCITMS